MMISPLLPRVLSVLLALGAIGGVVFMADSRTDRTWSLEPDWPYEQPAAMHWFYRVFATLPTQGAHLGIWGWAAHAWVYTGTIPATRESSSEFALRDWGPDGYYRKRYLDGLTNQPPEYFAVVVGPNQFLFKDRAIHGTQTVPGLQAFLAGNYQAVLDDGEAAIMIRRDVLATCCRQGRPGRAGKPSADDPDWMRFGEGSTADLHEAFWHLDVEGTQPTRLLAIPIRLGPGASTGSVRAGILQRDGSLAGCESSLAAAAGGAIQICLVEQPAGRSWRIGGRTTSDGDGTWIEVGRPFLTLAPSDGG